MNDMTSNSPKCQSQQQQRHKQLYKTSPNWQQIYKKQCLTRLNDRRHQNRSRLIERFRNIDINDTNCVQQLDCERQEMVKDVMQSVWDQFNTTGPFNVSDMTDFMEQMRQELLIEEDQYWEQLLEWRKQEEVEWLLTNRDSVVCFFCQKNPLIFRPLVDNKTYLFCSECGFNLTAQFSVSSVYLQERVDHIIGQHSTLCANTSLKFNQINDCSNNEFNNICLSCDVCQRKDLLFQSFNYLSINMC